jgi:hypothetical protein
MVVGPTFADPCRMSGMTPIRECRKCKPLLFLQSTRSLWKERFRLESAVRSNVADNRLRSGSEQPWMTARIRIAKDAVLNSGEGRHPVPVGLRLTHDMPDFLTPAHQRIGDQGPMATPRDSLAARLLGPDLVLCMTDFLRVHNATDRRIGENTGSPISKAPVKRHSPSSTRHSTNGAACGITAEPSPPHAYVTQSHPGCLRRQCRLLAEPHQSPIRIKASEGVRWTSTLAPGTSVPQTTVGTRPGPPQTAQAVWLPAGAIPLLAHGRGVSVPAAGGVGIQTGWH